MGIYDSVIGKTRKKIDKLYSEISKCEKEIEELNGARTKADSISVQVNEVMNNIFRKIDNKANSLDGNFATYYRENINQIVKDNRLYDISGSMVEDKNKINNKIVDLEERIRELQAQIGVCEADLSYYCSNNVEEAQVK